MAHPAGFLVHRQHDRSTADQMYQHQKKEYEAEVCVCVCVRVNPFAYICVCNVGAQGPGTRGCFDRQGA